MTAITASNLGMIRKAARLRRNSYITKPRLTGIEHIGPLSINGPQRQFWKGTGGLTSVSWQEGLLSNRTACGASTNFSRKYGFTDGTYGVAEAER